MRRTEEEINLHNQKIMTFLNLDRKSSKQFCNKTLYSQGENFPINDGIVASMSRYFKGMLTTEMKEKYDEKINLDTIPPKRLESVLDYIYTGDIELTEDNVLEVLEDANYMQMDDLKTFCGHYILHMVTTDSCVKLRAYATRYNLADVEKKLNQMIVDNIATVVQHDDFMQLDVGDMSAIIKQRGKNCEEFVFSGIVKWVNYNPHQREELFVNLFSQLDLSSMTSDFLEQVSMDNLVRKNLMCANMLVDGYKKMFKHRIPSSEFFLIGGQNSKEDCFSYDVITKQLKHKKKLNPGRSGLTSTRCGRKVYVMGGDGGDDGCEKKCQVLDLDDNTWSEMPDMLEKRKHCGSGCVKDFIYVTGGFSNGSSCEKLDITNKKWEKTRNMLRERTFHATVVCDDLLYCIGSYGNKRLDSCECFDPEVDEWKEIPSLNEARCDVACVVLDGYIYAIGGEGNNVKPMSTVERYKPGDDKWEYVASLQTARRGHSACVLQNKIFAIGGEGALTSVEVYDPTCDVWTKCFDLQKKFYFGSVVAL